MYVIKKLHYSEVDFDDEQVKTCFLNWRDEDVGRDDPEIPYPGTKKRVRKHRIQVCNQY